METVKKRNGTEPTLLLITFCGFAKKRISEYKTVKIAQKFMRGRMFN